MKRKWKLFAVLLFLAAHLNATAENQNYELPIMVVTSTMTERNMDVAPGTVDVIPRREIEALGAETVADVLRQAVGVNIVTGAGRSEEVSIRGLGPAIRWSCWTAAESPPDTTPSLMSSRCR